MYWAACNSCEATLIWQPESTPPGHHQFHTCKNVWLLCPLGCTSQAFFFFSFLPHFVVTCDLFLNRGTVTWSSFVNEIVITTNFPLGHTLYYRFRPFSLSWWPKINVRERISVGSDSVSSSLVNKNRYNSCYGWQRSNYNRSSMVYRWKSLSQWSEILGHGKFQTRFWNNRTKCC